MKVSTNWFSWAGEHYCRANFWDALGRYSTNTFLNEGDANIWLQAMKEG